MLPLIGRNTLGLSAAGYGALLLKRLRGKVAANTVSVWATLMLAATTLALPLAPNVWIGGTVHIQGFQGRQGHPCRS